MAKFEDILPALQATVQTRRPVKILAIDGQTEIRCDFRLLMTDDDAALEEAAVEYAIARKVRDPKPGNSQYERGLMLHTLLLACVDNEVKDRFEPYFRTVEQIGRFLDDGRCAVLFFEQRAFQKEKSPNPQRGQRPEDYLALVFDSNAEREKGGDPALPFVDLPRGMLVNFAVESVRLLCSPPLTRSDFGSGSPDAAASSSSSAPS
jgi:hypothetical protein